VAKDRPLATVCALFYGDHAALARRCLASLEALAATGRVRLRLAANEPCDETKALLAAAAAWPAVERVLVSPINYCKYPLMSQLFYEQALAAPYVVWFDDDSCLRPGVDAAAWLDGLARQMADADMVGALYRIRLGGKQHLWVRSRPWYAGKPVPPGHQVTFATGGWWCVKASVLTRWGWPEAEVRHRGGDVMLGELCRQQGYRLVQYNRGVAINAGDDLKQCTSKKRGVDEPPVGWHYHGYDLSAESA
jgi:hypothetical protein